MSANLQSEHIKLVVEVKQRGDLPSRLSTTNLPMHPYAETNATVPWLSHRRVNIRMKFLLLRLTIAASAYTHTHTHLWGSLWGGRHSAA